MRQFHIFQSWKRRTINDQSYELVKPLNFMIILTSRTSCRRSQVKSRNHGKTHTFQYQTMYLEAFSHNSRKEKKESTKLWTNLYNSKQTSKDH